MLEGKELIQPVGDLGEVSLDLTPEGKIVAMVSLKKEIDLVAALKAAAAKTSEPESIREKAKVAKDVAKIVASTKLHPSISIKSITVSYYNIPVRTVK